MDLSAALLNTQTLLGIILLGQKIWQQSAATIHARHLFVFNHAHLLWAPAPHVYSHPTKQHFPVPSSSLGSSPTCLFASNKTTFSSAIMFSCPSNITVYTIIKSLRPVIPTTSLTQKSKNRSLASHILHHHTSLSIPCSHAACYCIPRFKNILSSNAALQQLGLHVQTDCQPIILHAKKHGTFNFCKRLIGALSHAIL